MDADITLVGFSALGRGNEFFIGVKGNDVLYVRHRENNITLYRDIALSLKDAEAIDRAARFPEEKNIHRRINNLVF